MSPEMVEVILESAFEIHEFVEEEKHKQEFIERLSKIQSSLDQLIFREMVSSYEALIDALNSSNQETKRIRLNFAEENLLKNTGLDSSHSTAGVPNSRLIAQAHFGLAFICTLRGDDAMAATHCLRVYKSDPNYARKDLLPNIYTTLFQSKCADLFAWHDNERENILNDNFTFSVLGMNVLGGSIHRGSGTSNPLSSFSTSSWWNVYV